MRQRDATARPRGARLRDRPQGLDGSAKVSLAGTVTDIDPTTSFWSVVSEPGDPNSPDAVVADAAPLDTSITLSALGEYVLELQGDDGEHQTTDTLTVNVHINGCEAAKSLPAYVPLVGDLDEDCDVDQDDMDLLLENWLKCVALGECNPNDPNALFFRGNRQHSTVRSAVNWGEHVFFKRKRRGRVEGQKVQRACLDEPAFVRGKAPRIALGDHRRLRSVPRSEQRGRGA